VLHVGRDTRDHFSNRLLVEQIYSHRKDSVIKLKNELELFYFATNFKDSGVIIIIEMRVGASFRYIGNKEIVKRVLDVIVGILRPFFGEKVIIIYLTMLD
jgi:hypothetical protein